MKYFGMILPLLLIVFFKFTAAFSADKIIYQYQSNRGELYLCQLPFDEIVLAYDKDSCQRMIQAEKDRIDVERKKIEDFLSTHSPSPVSMNRLSEEDMNNVRRNYKNCREAKFKDLRYFCARCVNGLADKIYCGMNFGYNGF